MAAVPTQGPKILYLQEREVVSGGSRFRNGDTLFARITPCTENGKIAYVDCLPEAVVAAGSTEFIVFGPRKGLSDSRYLYHLARSNLIRTPAIARMIGTTGRQRVPNAVFDEIKILVPPLPEQRRIAEILSSVDDVIATTREVIEQAQRVRVCLLESLFHRGSWDKGKAMPAGWQLKLLDDVARRGSGHTPSKACPEYWNGGIKLISLQDTKRLDKVFISDTTVEISERGIANSSAVLHPAGIVVLSRDATVGRSAITTEPMAVSQHFIAWNCGENLDNVYLYYWLQHMKPVFDRIGAGSTIKTIGLPFFKKLEIPLPPLLEQQHLGRRMLEVDEAIFAEQKTHERLNAMKTALMSDLLAGRKLVPMAETNAAE